MSKSTHVALAIEAILPEPVEAPASAAMTVAQANAIVTASAITLGLAKPRTATLLSDALRVPVLLSAAPLALGRSGAPPTEFMVLANGTTDTLKGPIVCNAHACTRVLDAMRAAGRDKLPFDYNHGQVSFAGDGRAAGWFVPANRDGGPPVSSGRRARPRSSAQRSGVTFRRPYSATKTGT